MFYNSFQSGTAALEKLSGILQEASTLPEPEHPKPLPADIAGSVRFYGERLGSRMFRKHLAAYIDRAPWPTSLEARRAARARLCRLETPAEIEAALAALWLTVDQRLAA